MKRILACTLLLLYFCSCSKEEVISEIKHDIQPLTKAIVPEVFDWETADWMPTPPGQAQIPMPWGGQGSISAFYGPDIVYDFKKINGWRLLYSSFRDSGEELVDPYFMLYNIYRGTLRIYFFLTDPYIGSSTYLQDVLVLNKASNVSSNLLNYLDGSIVDKNAVINSFSQVQPKMPSGGAPLAGRRWYMIEYEMAYDPDIDNNISDQFYLTWFLNYYNIDSLEISGTEKSEIYGTIGASNNTLTEAANSTGKGVLSILGLDLMNSLTLDSDGENKIGIDRGIFNALKNGITAAVNSFGSGIPSIAINVLSAIISGTSTTSLPAVSLKSDASIHFNGNFISQGAVSSTPIDFKIPGTEIPSDASGFIPLYNEPLGVFYLDGHITVDMKETITVSELEDDIMWTGKYKVYTSRVLPGQQDYSQYIIVNPAVSKVANVSVISQEVYASPGMLEFPVEGVEYESPWEGDNPLPEIDGAYIKFLIKVEPKDGSPATYICKTFEADDYTWTTRYVYL